MELTDEQISKLRPEQITEFENNPEAVDEYLANQEKDADEPEQSEKSESESDEPEQAEQDGAANGAGDDEEEEAEPIVLNKSGKGTIPYEKHKELRVENASLREQLQEFQRNQEELESLRKKQAEAGTTGKRSDIQKAIAQKIADMKEDYPEMAETLDMLATIQASDREEWSAAEAAAKAQADAAAAEQKRIIDEQVQDAKENNPDLVYWEQHDPDAWDEALKQDEILRHSTKWAKKSYDERFIEVVRRVRAVNPEATEPPNQAPSAKTQAKAKATLEKAPVRKPTTLSDVPSGGNPVSEKEQMDNLTPHQLAARLMKMPLGKAAAMRADLD